MHPWKVSLVLALSLSTQLSSTLSLPVKHSLEHQQEHYHQHQLANSIVKHQHDRSEQDLHLDFERDAEGHTIFAPRGDVSYSPRDLSIDLITRAGSDDDDDDDDDSSRKKLFDSIDKMNKAARKLKLKHDATKAGSSSRLSSPSRQAGSSSPQRQAGSPPRSPSSSLPPRPAPHSSRPGQGIIDRIQDWKEKHLGVAGKPDDPPWKHSRDVSDDPPQLEAPDYEKRLVKKLFSRLVRRSLKQWAAKKIVNKSLKMHVAKMKSQIKAYNTMKYYHDYERKGKAIMPSPPPKQKYYWAPEGMPNPNRPVIIGGSRHSQRGLDAADLVTDAIQVDPRGMESAFKKMLGKKIVDTALKVTGGIRKKQKEEELKRKKKKVIDSTSSPPHSPKSPESPHSPGHPPSPSHPPAPGPQSTVTPLRPTFKDIEKLWNIDSSRWRSRRHVDDDE